MDFVASKVGMSICALMVSSILVAVHDDTRAADLERELDGLACGLAEDLSSALLGGVESRIVDKVPWLSTGEAVDLAVGSASLLLRCGNAVACVGLAHDVHLWQWNGTCLEDGEVEALDSEASPLALSSGDIFETTVEEVTVNGVDVLMLFVHPARLADGQNLSAMPLTASTSASASSTVL